MAVLVLCVGSGAQNVGNEISQNDAFKVITINTDEQVLKTAKTEAVLFPNISNGESYGCGGDIETGRTLALKNCTLLKDEIEKSDSVVIISCFGGGTGTGATPVIAEYVRQLGKKVSVIATLPFSFEGKRRTVSANTYIEDLENICDLTLIKNDKMLELIDGKIGVHDAFAIINRAIIEKLYEITKKGEIL